ncbi:MAG TPA: hypothetical protein VFL83_12945 [Anaeromyxobacter sp.]|nr:hypothetical protein [Anaeromyxobacter sp.]
MKISKLSIPAAPALFATVRRSRDLSLVAFATALLGALALQAGAFLPKLSSPDVRPERPALHQPATPTPAAAAVVARQPAPCTLPRG